jgi:zinc resistance-associated protein
MWKPALAGTIVLALAGSSLVYAQQRPDRMGPGRMDRTDQARRPNIDDMRAFGEARLAALKAGLTLTPEQEKNWPAFEQAARDLQKLRFDRAASAMASRRSGDAPRSTDPAERLSQRATAMTETGNALKKLAEATDPLYKSLDDNQKRRFAILARLGGPDGLQFRGRDRDHDRGGRPWDRRRAEGGPGMHGHDMMPDHDMMPGHRMGPGHEGMPGRGMRPDQMPGRGGMMPGRFDETPGSPNGAERI